MAPLGISWYRAAEPPVLHVEDVEDVHLRSTPIIISYGSTTGMPMVKRRSVEMIVWIGPLEMFLTYYVHTMFCVELERSTRDRFTLHDIC